MATGVYGWWCESCDLDTRTTRDGMPDGAAVCYGCGELFEGAHQVCARCKQGLTELGADGTFREGADRAGIERYWRERLASDAKLEAFKQRFRAAPSLVAPGPDPMRAYEAWFSDLMRAYQQQGPALDADPTFRATAAALVSEQTLEQRVQQSMVGARKFRCPRCKAFGLTSFTVPFPG